MFRMLAGKKEKIGLGAAALAIFLAAAIYLGANAQKTPSGPVVEPTGVAIRGTVTDEAKAPLANAKVFVYSAGVREGTSPYCPTCYADCAKSGTTDAQGNFVIENVDPALVFRLLVAASGFKPQFKGKVDPAKGAVEIAVRKRDLADLKEKSVLEGKILSPEGKAVVGAVITPFQFVSKESTLYGPAKEDSIALSDNEGRFTLVVGGGYTAAGVEVEARGLAKRKFLALALGKEIHDMKMEVGTTVKGRLLRGGKPVAAVNVGLCQSNRSSDSFLGESIVGTNEKGEFLFTNILGNDTYCLYGKRDSLKEQGVTETRLYAAKANGTVADMGDIEVLPGLPIEASIQLSDGKTIPPKTTVLISRPDAWDTLRLQPDVSGKIHFSALPGEVLELAANIPGYVPVFEKKNAWQDNPSFVITADTKKLTLDFKPKSEKEKISGIVVDSKNQPVAGARLVMFAKDRGLTVLNGSLQRGLDEGAVDSDAEGRFSLIKGDDRVGVVALHKKGYAYVPLASWQGTLQLKPWAQIRGKAFLGKVPAAGKKVVLVGQERMTPEDRGPGFICKSPVAEDGTYQLDYVAEGFQLLGVSVEQNNPYASSWFQQVPAEVKSGESLELQLGGKGAAVSGKVEMPEGFQGTLEQTLAFGSLQLESPSPQGKVLEGEEARRAMIFGQRSYGFTVEKEGSFKVEDVLPGNYFLRIELRTSPGESNRFGESVADGGVRVTVAETESLGLSPLRLTLIPKPLKPGDVLPKFELKNIRGEKIDNESLSNRVTLFRFHSPTGDDDADTYFANLLAGLGPKKQLRVISFGMWIGSEELIKKYENSTWPWQECHWSEEANPLALSFPNRQSPYYVVIGPEGEVKASSTDFEVIKKALAEGFGKTQVSKVP